MKRRTAQHEKHAVSALLSDGRIRILLLAVFFFAGIAVLWCRLFFFQVTGAEKHQREISSQSLRRIRIPNLRGKISSSDNVVLAENRLEFELVFYPEEMQKRTRRSSVINMYDNAVRAAEMVGRENKVTAGSILNHIVRRPGIPFTVLKGLDTVEVARALEFARMTPGSDVVHRMVRVYPQGRTACHLIGFTGLEDRTNASDKEDFFYYHPDAVGRSGVEKAFDILPGKGGIGLKGYSGYSLIQVDKLGYAKNHIIHEIPPVPGANVVLTLDVRAQKIAEKLLSGYRGAMVVLDASNGDVIAAASAPGYDLAQFTPSVSGKYYNLLRNDPGRPLVNRAFMGSYTPGSILKPLVMLSMLSAEDGNVSDIICDGASKIGDARIRCASYRRGGHGEVDCINALNWSCNDFMIENAVKSSPERLFEQMKNAGLGRKSGIELPESSGIAPSQAEKRRRYRYGWTKYDTALLSIGQGIVAVSPLQAALFCAALANGGTIYRPHLVKEVIDNTGIVTYSRKITASGYIQGTPSAFETVRKGMFEVVNSSNGSGRRAAVRGLEIYGKTGSAEIGRRGNMSIIAWFIAYTEFKGKKYAIAVVIEGGDSGGMACAPLAGRFLRSYLL